MSKINRYNGNVKAFGSEATGTERTIFGDTAQSNTLDGNITADLFRGWGIIGPDFNPTKQDFNGLAFTLGQLIAYLHQRGVPEWNSSQEYYEGSVVTTLAGIYRLKAGGDGSVDPDIDGGTNWELAPTRAQVDAKANQATTYTKAESDALVAGTPLFKIAVIGDSLCTENALAEHAWPSLMQKYINNSGGDCRVVNYARNSFTFAEASTDVNAFDGRTALQAVIDEKPNVVMCAFGIVDVIANDAGKTLAALKSDAQSFYSELRTGLPDAQFCQVEQVAYDKVNATRTALTNNDVLPYFMQRATSGILAGSFCSEILSNSINSTIQTNINNGVEFYSYIQGLPEVDYLFEIDYWKIARIGLTGPDGLHPATFGKILQSGYAITELVNNTVDPFFAKLRVKNYESWYNPDDLIDGIINKTANWNFQYFARSGQDHAVNLSTLYKEVAPTVWYLPYKTSVSIPRLSYDAGQPFLVSLFNGPPGQVVLPSIDGGAFDANNPTLDLTISGCGSVSIIDPVTPGTYTFRYKCGPEIYGPYTFVFNSGGSAGTLAISDGGTSATSAVGARTNLDVYSTAESDALGGGGVDAYTKTESDARFLNEASSLTDLNSANVARAALGLTQDGPLTPSLASGWTDGGTSYKSPQYYKDHNDRVYLEGAVKRTSGSGTTCFTLPFGYRPSGGVGFVTPIQGQPKVMLVNSDGTVELADYTTNNDLAFLDGISFMAN